jgi:hypothetical protein
VFVTETLVLFTIILMAEADRFYKYSPPRRKVPREGY